MKWSEGDKKKMDMRRRRTSKMDKEMKDRKRETKTMSGRRKRSS